MFLCFFCFFRHSSHPRVTCNYITLKVCLWNFFFWVRLATKSPRCCQILHQDAKKMMLIMMRMMSLYIILHILMLILASFHLIYTLHQNRVCKLNEKLSSNLLDNVIIILNLSFNFIHHHLYHVLYFILDCSPIIIIFKFTFLYFFEKNFQKIIQFSSFSLSMVSLFIKLLAIQ